MDFQWDQGNSGKSLAKHNVTNEECEETFFDEDKVQSRDRLHSDAEKRCILLGKTKDKRLLVVIYTLRRKRIRVISARDINRKEARLYSTYSIPPEAGESW